MSGERKLIFFDVDGTLVPSDSPKGPSAGVCDALQTLRRAGHKVFVCTGRTLCDIGEELLHTGFDGVVAGAGAYISLEGSCFYHNTITSALLRETIDAILRCRVSCVLEGTYGFYYAGSGSRLLDWDFPRIESAEHLTGKESIEKFTAHVSEPAEFEPLRSFLLRYYEIYPADDGRFFEMARRGLNKASAIHRLCTYYRISPSDTIAFGDSRNDLSMLQAAGVGVAMGNAPEEVRAAATLVTGTVQEDGVLTALHKLALLEDSGQNIS